MSFDRLLVHRVTVLRPGSTTDRYGNLTASWSSGVVETPTSGWVSQRSRSEDNDGRQAEVSDWVAFLPEGTDVRAGDRVRWDDPSPTVTFEAVGPPNRAWTPRGEHHVELSMRVVAG